MALLDLFHPAPYQEEIQDAEVVKKHYKYWRFRIFYSMWLGYAFFYFTRKSFTFALPSMQEQLGLGKIELGLLASVLYISYGISKFVSGIMGDKSNPRFFMAFGLILTGVFNIFFGMSSSIWAFALFWGLNGWFQGWGWPGCAKLLTHWYSQSERGRWWSAWNTSHNIGGILIALIGAACCQYFNWQVAMYVPGFLCILGGLFLLNRLRDTPQSLGLPAIEKFRGDASSKTSQTIQTELSVKQILMDYVLKNRFIWLLSISYFLIYVVRTAINDWSMLYLMEVKNYSALEAGFCVCWFEVGGFLGSLAAGWMSDLLFKGKRNPINVLFALAVVLTICAFRFFHLNVPVLDAGFIFLFGFFIFGPQMLIGMAAAELSHKKAAATSTGFVGCFAYLGAATAGGPLGMITKTWGWDSYLITLTVCAFLGALIVLPIWNVKSNDKQEQEGPLKA